MRTKSTFTLSIFGFSLFFVFYIIAALTYPGGSYEHPNQFGFNFRENYLCDLLDEQALIGVMNSAKIYARISLGCLCFGIFMFWLLLPKLFTQKSKTKEIMRISGIISMITTVFIASGNHDVITRIAGLFGVIALILSFILLFNHGYIKLLFFGIVCLLLIILNYYIYEIGYFRSRLPIIQKITTIGCVSWFVILNLKIYKRVKI